MKKLLTIPSLAISPQRYLQLVSTAPTEVLCDAHEIFPKHGAALDSSQQIFSPKVGIFNF